ncbi:MAG: pyrroline-5-carboxylate reductase, partial [Gammaproteobacteria bacterium]|nr:pyrroline-5-carboxylate reductase [Gammaproteobacteria bacterium]
GPAYFFLMMEALEQAGTALGLPAETARQLAIETAYGAGAFARQSEDDPGTLRAKVTSPGGTTEAALAVFNTQGFTQTVKDAAGAAAQRAEELAVLALGDKR